MTDQQRISIRHMHAEAHQAQPLFERIEIKREPNGSPQTPTEHSRVRSASGTAPKPPTEDIAARQDGATPAPSTPSSGSRRRSPGGGGTSITDEVAPTSAMRGRDGSVTLSAEDWRKVSRLIDHVAKQRGL